MAATVLELGYRIFCYLQRSLTVPLNLLMQRTVDSLLMDCRPWQDWEQVRRYCSIASVLKRLLEQVRHTLEG